MKGQVMNSKRYIALFIFQLCMGLGALEAVTRVFLINQTSQSLSLSYVQSGAPLAVDKWTPGGLISAPGTTMQVLSFDRSVGIKDDAVYEFSTSVAFDATTTPIVLRQRLEGTLLSSKLALSASGGSFSHPWYTDRDVHQQMFKIGNDAYQLKYYSQKELINDDIYYIIEPVLASEPTVVPAPVVTVPAV
jgi:hypothetical protein